MKTPRKTNEADLQEAIVTYVRAQYPHVIIFAIPNGGKRNDGDQAEKKRTGILAGVPDLFVAQPMKKKMSEDFWRLFHGLFIEVKAGKSGVTSPEQRQLLEDLSLKGYESVIVRDLDSAIKIIDNYLK